MLNLSKPETKVVSKVLNQMGWATRKIEEWTGVDHATVARYAKIPTPEELKQFETEFKTVVIATKQEILASVLYRLAEIIPKERKISELVKAGEFVEGKQNTNVLVQQNNINNDFDLTQAEIDRILA